VALKSRHLDYCAEVSSNPTQSRCDYYTDIYDLAKRLRAAAIAGETPEAIEQFVERWELKFCPRAEERAITR
jgi:hypothetical protein